MTGHELGEKLPEDFLATCFRIPHDASPRWLLMLTAYVDETGQEQDDWMFVAGYYGNDASWKRVAEEWPKAIGPQRKHLHMKELRFKRESERQMLERAALVPKRCGLVPILGGVRRNDYRERFRGTPEDKLLNGYVVSLWAMLADTLANLPEGERLEIVFEHQPSFEHYAQAAIGVFVTFDDPALYLPNGIPKLAGWRWVPKESTSLLEPADYLCYALAKYHKDRESERYRWVRPIMDAQAGEGFGRIMTPDAAHKAFLGKMDY